MSKSCDKCGQKDHHYDKCGEKDHCCDIIAESIGDYFLRSGGVLDSALLNQTFIALLPADATTRTQLFQTFLSTQNTEIRTAFKKLSDLLKCKHGKVCCSGVARGLVEAGIGFLNLGFQATLTLSNPIISPGLPVLSLEEVLASITLNARKTFDLILCISTI